MKKKDLANVYWGDEDITCLRIDKYLITPKADLSSTKVNSRYHQKAGSAEFEEDEEQSIIFKGGEAGDPMNPIMRTFFDDVLLLGSIFTGYNWAVYEDLETNWMRFHVLPRSYLEFCLQSNAELLTFFDIAIQNIKKDSWQIQFENGFHLRMLVNHANIVNAESRFLSYFVIWEWLYPHLINPNGATAADETGDLKKIMDTILNTYWKKDFEGEYIFHALRNQLVHSGKIPIDRKYSYAEDWMKELKWKDNNGIAGIDSYIRFFDRLTHVIVLKTLGIDVSNFILGNKLNIFLKSGKLQFG